MTSEGQVTIPSEVRKHLGISHQDWVIFVVTDEGRVEIRPARFTLDSVRGIVPARPGRESIDFDDQIEEAIEVEAGRITRRLESR